MGKYDGSLSVEHEVAPELTPVLIEMDIGDASAQQRLAVEEHDIGMCVGSQERGPPKSECSIRGPIRIEGDLERQRQSILHPGNALSGLERDHDDRRTFEPVFQLGHLHEMAFTEKSTDVAKESQNDGRAPERIESQLLSLEGREAKIGRSIAHMRHGAARR